MRASPRRRGLARAGRPEPVPDRRSRRADEAPTRGSEPVTGAHEVVILSPDHHASFGRLDDAAAIEVLTVIRDRVRFHLEAGHAYVQAFVNQGKAAGASIAHPHAQVVALDLVPPAVDAALDRFATDGPRRARARRRRAGTTSSSSTGPRRRGARSPRSRRTACASRTGPRGPGFDEATDAEVAVVAVALRDALAALHGTLGEAPYNVVIRTAPPERGAGEFHWHLDVHPAHQHRRRVRGGHGHLREHRAARAGRGAAARGRRIMTVEIRLCETIGVPPDDGVGRDGGHRDAHRVDGRRGRDHVPHRAAHRASAPSSSASPRSARSRPPT